MASMPTASVRSVSVRFVPLVTVGRCWVLHVDCTWQGVPVS